MNESDRNSQSKNDGLISQVRRLACTMHIAKRTEEAYVGWITRYLVYHRDSRGDWIHPLQLGSSDVNDFLSYLAVERRVAASTQNQALSALRWFLCHPKTEQNLCRSSFTMLCLASPFIDQRSYQSGPTRLMAGSESLACIRVEVLMEQQAISPMRIRLHHRPITINRAVAISIASEHRNHTIRVAFGHIHQSRAGFQICGTHVRTIGCGV